MTLPLTAKKIAILVANGFDENQMAEIQRALIKVKADIKTVSPEQGVVNGWQGEGWGHHFPVNAQIGEALGSDFDMLVLPGGSRGVARLKTSPHTRRIINHFVAAGKPIAAIGDAVGLLALTGQLHERTFAAPNEVADELEAAGAAIATESIIISDNILSADGTDLTDWVDATVDFFAETEAVKEAA